MTIVTSKLTSLPRLFYCAVAWLCLCALPAPAAEVSPARLLLLRGTVALGEGRLPPAVADLREAALMHPEDWRCQFLYGQALAQAGDQPLARAQFRRAALLEPSTPDVWMTLARAARELNDPHLELAALAGYLRLFPDDPQQLQRLALLYRATGRRAEADKVDAQWRALLPPLKLDYRFLVGFHSADLGELRDLHAQEPDNRAILYALATEEWKAGHRAETRACLRTLYGWSPDNTELAAAYVHACLLDGEIDEALRVLRDAAPRGNYALDRALALWSLSTGRPADAVEPLQRLLIRNPIDTVQNRQLGWAQQLTGNPQSANAAYRTAWLRDHDHLTAQQYAVTLQQDGHIEEAERVLRQAMEAAPAETALSLQLARLYRDIGRLAESAEALLAVAKKRPETAELLLLAGERFFRAGHIQRAYTTACLLRDQHAGNAVAMLGAVQLFRRLAARSEARVTLTRYLGPSFPPPLPKTEIMLLIARDAAADNRLGDATQALVELLNGSPECRDGYRALGNLYLQQANWQEAIRCYQSALARWPEDGEFALALARATAQAGNLPQAVVLYRQAAQRLATADPWLQLGTLHARLDDDAQARACWLTATKLDGGAIPGRLSLLSSYTQRGETAPAAELAEELRTLLTEERQTRRDRWQRLLAAAGEPATAEEIDALLLLEPDLPDPATLTARLQEGEPKASSL